MFTIRYSIRSLLPLTVIVALIIIVALEILMTTKIESGGEQEITFTVIPKTTKQIVCIPIRNLQATEELLLKFETGDRLKIKQQMEEFEHSLIRNDLKKKFAINQQWSWIEGGVSKQSTNYTQSYHYVVFNITNKDGNTNQFFEELPKFGQPLKIDLSRRKQAAEPSNH